MRVRPVRLRLENLYPPSVAVIARDWQVDDHSTIVVGDCFVQSIPLYPIGNPVGMVCMDEVAHIYDSPNKCGFTVVSTNEHDGVGAHAVWVKAIKKSNTLLLESTSVSVFKSHVFGPGLWYALWLQQRAHPLGQMYFQEQIENSLHK